MGFSKSWFSSTPAEIGLMTVYDIPLLTIVNDVPSNRLETIKPT